MTNVEYTEDGDLFIPLQGTLLGPQTQSALRELFRSEEDERIGRWRWPANPEWVVYARRPGFAACNGADLLVINEVHGSAMEYVRLEDDGTEYVGLDEPAAEAARAYFEAHPERKPWHDAKPGEVWVVTEGDLSETYPYLVDDEQFYDSARDYALDFTDPAIIAARRIWPEDAS